MEKLGIERLSAVLIFTVPDKRCIILNICLYIKLVKIHIQQIIICLFQYGCCIGIRICSVCPNILFTQHCLDHSQLTCVNIFTPAVRSNVLCPADKEQYLFGYCHTLVRIIFGGKAFHKPFQFSCFVKSHSSVQRIYIAYAAHIRQLRYFLRNFDIYSFRCIEQVGGYPQLAHACGRAVCSCKGRCVSYCCLCVRSGINVFIIQIYGDYPQLIKSFHLALSGNTVPVSVHPYHKL